MVNCQRRNYRQFLIHFKVLQLIAVLLLISSCASTLVSKEIPTKGKSVIDTTINPYSWQYSINGKYGPFNVAIKPINTNEASWFGYIAKSTEIEGKIKISNKCGEILNETMVYNKELSAPSSVGIPLSSFIIDSTENQCEDNVRVEIETNFINDTLSSYYPTTYIEINYFHGK